METIKRFYTVAEIAEMLHLSTKTVYTYMKDGKLHAVKIGKYWHISEENLNEFLKGDKQA